MRLIDADALLEKYDLKNCTKYGNETEEQQRNSYDTMMMYEIADMIEDAPTAYDLESVIDTLEKYISQQSENEMLSDNGKWLACRVIKECIKIIKSGTTATNGKNGEGLPF